MGRRDRTPVVLLLACLSLAISGCAGQRAAQFLEQSTVTGQWRWDGTLIRRYAVDLETGFKAAQQVCANAGWEVETKTKGEREASLTAREKHDLLVHFRLWSPEAKTTDIGIRYADGDRYMSIEIFEKLEKQLPEGARVEGES